MTHPQEDSVKQIIHNAVLSIRVAIEDFSTATHARMLSAVRNLQAGVLLLFKAKLVELSPVGSDEVLIKAQLKPRLLSDGAVDFVGRGKKTVDVAQIRERFEALGINVDWVRVTKLVDERNRIEHYYPTASPAAMRAVVADAFLIIRDFVALQLHKEPRDLLGDATWQTMLDNADVYARERKDCEQQLGRVDWQSDVLQNAVFEWTCDSCGSPLLTPLDATQSFDDQSLACRSCGDVSMFGDFAEAALSRSLDAERYTSVRDGGEDPLMICPDCARKTFVVEDDRCVGCGYTRQYLRCIRCENELTVEEQELDGLCEYCEHMCSKDD
jgi:hypothetical protein